MVYFESNVALLQVARPHFVDVDIVLQGNQNRFGVDIKGFSDLVNGDSREELLAILSKIRIEGLDGGICIEFFKQYGMESNVNGSAILGDIYARTLESYWKTFDMDFLDHAKSLTQWVLSAANAQRAASNGPQFVVPLTIRF